MSDQFDPYHVWLGIPREEQPPNHYRLLGLRLFEADADVISNALDQRRAYLRTLQAGKRAALSQKLLNEVSAAGVTLLDEASKKEYDRELRALEAAAKPPARKNAIPTARSLESIPASVIPLSASAALPPAAAYAPPLATLPPQAVEPAPAPAFVAPIAPQLSASSQANRHKRQRSAGGLLVGLVLAGCILALLATAGAVIWVIQGSKGEIAVDPKLPSVAGDPEQPPAADPKKPDKGTNQPEPPPGSVTPSVQPPAVPGNDSRQVWVFADNARGGFRQLDANRWVEMTPDAVVGYQVISRDAQGIRLGETGSRRSVRLLADRVERHDPELTGTTVFLGKWRSIEGLPPFARRTPAPETVRPQPDLQSHKFGLVFDGESQLQLPAPAELSEPGQPFTIELWVRFADAETPATLLAAGNLKLTYSPTIVGSQESVGLWLTSGNQTIGNDNSLVAGRFHHFAITSDGQQGRLVVNGNPLAGQQLAGLAAPNGSILVGFDPQSKKGLRGMVRGLRISNVNRYPDRTLASELPKILVADDHALVALDFQAGAGDELRDLTGTPENARPSGAVWAALDYFGEYTAEKNWGSIDLMRTFLANHHTLEGESRQTESELLLQAPSGRNRVLVPHLPPENYRFEAAAQRTEGEGGLVIGLVLGKQPAALCIDGKVGSTRVTGLMSSNGDVLPSSRPLSCPSLYAAGMPRKLVCEVSARGDMARVRLQVDGQAAYEWTGPIAAAAAPAQWQVPCRTLFVGSFEAAFGLREMALQRLSSPAADLVASSTGDADSRSRLNTSPLPGTPGFARERLPVPTQTVLDAELAKAWAIYDGDWKEALKPLQKATVANGVLKAGQETTGDPTSRYVLIEVARKMFVAAGEVNAALGAARQLEAEFTIPPHQTVAATLSELEKGSLLPEERGQFAEEALTLAEATLAAGDFERADELSLMAAQSITRLKDAELKKDVTQRRAQISGTVKQWNLIKASRDALANTPADPAANLAVGKFYCLVMDDWTKGLAHLAKSGNSPFAAAAQLDDKGSNGDAAASYAAAEAWAKLANDSKAGDREQRLALQLRAKGLLEESLAKLDGLEKVNAQKLLDQLKDVAAKSKRPSDPRATMDRPGLVGRVIGRAGDTGILISYEPDYMLTQEDLEKVRTAAGVKVGEPWQIVFQGLLSLPMDSRVEVWHAGGSPAGGVHALYLATKKVNEVGDNRPKNLIQHIDVPRGQHTVRWVLSGGDMGTAGMRLTPTDVNGQTLDHRTTLMATRDLINAARRLPTKTELHFP